MDMSDKQIADKAAQIVETARPLILLESTCERLVFDSQYVTIGRIDDCDIVLSDSCVSPVHAIFSRSDLGWTVTDKNSVNGTYINNQRIESGTAHLLHDADVLTIPMQRLDEELLYIIKDEVPPPRKEASDGTMILSEPSIWWNHQFIFFASIRENRQPETGRSFLKYDKDGNLYSDIPSPEYMKEHKYKQCKHCGAFAENKEKRCPSCGQNLPPESLGYVDPVIYTDNFREIEAELYSLMENLFPHMIEGMGEAMCSRKQRILSKWYHILWRTPSEMNPGFFLI